MNEDRAALQEAEKRARTTERIIRAEMDEGCRCGHPRGLHGPEGCRSPMTWVGTDHVSPYPCGCERFREPDSDE